MAKLRHIALLIGQDLSFCREVIRGIRAYALRKSDWAIRNGPPDVQILPSLREWKPDGIIAELFHAEFARKLLRMRKPVVDTAFWLPNLKVPVVDVDHAAVGRMAAEYFLSLNLTRFAFFGSASAEYSRHPPAEFRATAAGSRTRNRDLSRRVPSRGADDDQLEKDGVADRPLAAAVAQARGAFRQQRRAGSQPGRHVRPTGASRAR